MGEFNGIAADKNSFLHIGADSFCAGFKVVCKAENVIGCKQQVTDPNSCCNVSDVINGKPTDKNNHYAFGNNVAIE